MPDSARVELEKIAERYEVHHRIVDEILASLSSLLIAEVGKLIETRYLKKDNLQWQLGWVEGHKEGITEVQTAIGRLLT